MVVDEVPSGDDDNTAVCPSGWWWEEWEVSQHRRHWSSLIIIRNHHKRLPGPAWLRLTEVKAVIVSSSAEMLRHHHRCQVRRLRQTGTQPAAGQSQIPDNTRGEETPRCVLWSSLLRHCLFSVFSTNQPASYIKQLFYSEIFCLKSSSDRNIFILSQLKYFLFLRSIQKETWQIIWRKVKRPLFN